MGEPDHTATTILALEQSFQSPGDRFFDAVVLVPLGDYFECRSTIGTAESNEPTEEIEQGFGLQQALDQNFELQPTFGHFLAGQQAPP